MKLNQRIIIDIRHVHQFAFAQNRRMFLHHQPTHVGKEKPTIRIVGVCMGFREFVMDSVVSNPLRNRILEEKYSL